MIVEFDRVDVLGIMKDGSEGRLFFGLDNAFSNNSIVFELVADDDGLPHFRYFFLWIDE